MRLPMRTAPPCTTALRRGEKGGPIAMSRIDPPAQADGPTNAIDKLSRAVGHLAALLMLPNIAIVVMEVALRYLLNKPTIWVNESSQFLFGFSFLLGGAYTLAVGGHVRVDALFHLFSRRGQALVELVTYPFVFFYLGVILWIGGERAIEAIRAFERTDSAWGPYLFPVLAAVPVAAALMLLQAAVLFWRDLQRVRRG